eukprot:403369096
MNQAGIALLAVTLATFINSLGYIFYKFAHLRLENNPSEKISYVFTWQFMCGFALIVLGAVINIVSLAFADQITLSSTSSLTLVFNSILATRLLGEEFTRYDLLSIILISLGASLCVILSNYQPIPLTIEELVSKYTSTQSIVLMIITVLFLLAAYKVGEKVIVCIHHLFQDAKNKGELLESFLDKSRLGKESDTDNLSQLESHSQNKQQLLRQLSFDVEDSKKLIPNTHVGINEQQTNFNGMFRSQIPIDVDRESNYGMTSYNDQNYEKNSNQPPTTAHHTNYENQTPLFHSMKEEQDRDMEKINKFDLGTKSDNLVEPTISKLIEKVQKLDEQDLKMISPNFKKIWIRIPLILYPWASGLLSGMTTSFIKGVAEMMKNHDIMELVVHPLPYICLAICGVNIIGQLYTLNTGLKYYNQLEVIPIYQSSVILNNILCGGLIFNEFQLYTWWQMLLISLGCLICVCGILVIAKKYQFLDNKTEKQKQQQSQSANEMKEMFCSSSPFHSKQQKSMNQLNGDYQRL